LVFKDGGKMKKLIFAVMITALLFAGCGDGYSGGVMGSGGQHFNADINYGSFTDTRDGQVYRTVRIGNLEWMAENFNYKAGNSWNYANSASYGATYGRLYDWFTAISICPPGWRLPTDSDWIDLIETVSGSEDNPEIDLEDKIRIAAEKLKSKIGWNDNGGGTDEFGFSALPGGYGRSDLRTFMGAGRSGFWWGTTQPGAWIMGLGDGLETGIIGLNAGLSVRYVRDRIH
jgi:uncharacterized protein (TIGR02145 family)